jgi:hypothetical protein
MYYLLLLLAAAIQSGKSALDMAKTQEIRDLLNAHYAGEELFLAA